jgi:hypothetical protein
VTRIKCAMKELEGQGKLDGNGDVVWF